MYVCILPLVSYAILWGRYGCIILIDRSWSSLSNATHTMLCRTRTRYTKLPNKYNGLTGGWVTAFPHCYTLPHKWRFLDSPRAEQSTCRHPWWPVQWHNQWGFCKKRDFGFFSLFFPINHIMTGPILSEASNHSWFDAPKSVSVSLFFWTLSFSKIFCYLLHLSIWNNTYQRLIQSLVFEKLSISSFLLYKNQDAHECWQMIGLHCQHFSDHYYVSSAISV